MLQSPAAQEALAERFRMHVDPTIPTHRLDAMVSHLYLIAGNWNNAMRADVQTLRTIAAQH